jgi:mevalonate kinase
MNILESMLGQVDDIAAKLGLPADQAKSLVSGLAEKVQNGGDITQTLTEAAQKFGVSPEKLESLTGADGPLGGIMAKLGGAGGMLSGLDKDGDGNPLNDIAGMAKGLFGGKA